VNLLIYSHAFAPGIGGVETIVMTLARGLAQGPAKEGAACANLTVVTQTPAGRLGDDALPFRVVRRPGFFALLALLRRADVVHLAGPALLPLALGLFLRKPTLIEHHGFQTICPNGQLLYEPEQSPCPGHFMARRHSKCLRCNAKLGLLTSLRLWLLTFARRWLAKRAAANILPTEWLGTQLALPRAVAIRHALEDVAQPTPGTRSGDPVIAFQGRLVTTKGVHVLLEAARILRERGLRFELRVIGDGPERKSLEEQARRMGLGDAVRFCGALQPEALDRELAEAGVVVVPSLGGEVFGLVLAENMLRGRAVVVSDLGAFTEVAGDAGLSFRTGDAGDLARQLERLLRDPAFRLALGNSARRRALECFARQRMIKEHLELYRRAVFGNRAC
jgi:glycosyltransferase involved in cell wall biosynthesis